MDQMKMAIVYCHQYTALVSSQAKVHQHKFVTYTCITYSTVTDKATELTGLTGWNIHRRLYNKQGCIVDLHKDTYGARGEWYT